MRELLKRVRVKSPPQAASHACSCWGKDHWRSRGSFNNKAAGTVACPGSATAHLPLVAVREACALAAALDGQGVAGLKVGGGEVRVQVRNHPARGVELGGAARTSRSAVAGSCRTLQGAKVLSERYILSPPPPPPTHTHIHKRPPKNSLHLHMHHRAPKTPTTTAPLPPHLSTGSRLNSR
jgi:hypothetical protein